MEVRRLARLQHQVAAFDGCSAAASWAPSLSAEGGSRCRSLPLLQPQRRAQGRADLVGKAAIANACVAYKHFQSVCESARWKALSSSGAQVQRPLWASTSTKNPSYPDTLYVQELVAKDTVNTMPPATLAAWKDHGRPEAGLERNIRTSDMVLSQIREAGVDLSKVTADLIDDGVKKFADSFDQLLGAIEQKAKSVSSAKARV